MTKIEVTSKIKATAMDYMRFCNEIDNSLYFKETGDKWNTSENTRHLTLAASPLILAFSLPRVILKIAFGKSNRNSLTYDAMLIKYHDRLQKGGKASKPYVPIKGQRDVTKDVELKDFMRIHDKFIAKLEKWKDEELDIYILPHPL